MIKLSNSHKRLSNKTLTKALLERDIPYECSKCCLGDKWNGKELKLKVDHKDADPFNNKESNLRFLCPNCYSQSNQFLPRIKKSKKNMSCVEEIQNMEDNRVMKILAKIANDMT